MEAMSPGRVSTMTGRETNACKFCAHLSIFSDLKCGLSEQKCVIAGEFHGPILQMVITEVVLDIGC